MKRRLKFEAFGYGCSYPEIGYKVNVSMNPAEPYEDRHIVLTFDEVFESWVEVEEFSNTKMVKAIIALCNKHLRKKL